MALRTAGVLWWECDVTDRPEAAVIHRRQRETPAGGVTVATARASYGMNVNKDLRCSGRALDGERDSRSRRIDETPSMRTIMAVRAILARDSGRGVVDKPAHECRRVVTVATV